MPMDVFVGLKFGELTVLSFEQKQGKTQKSWYAKCRCDCGTEKLISWCNIKNGRSKSCGCKTYINSSISKKRSRNNWYETRAEEIFSFYEENPHLTIYEIGLVFKVTPQRVQQCVARYDPDKTHKERVRERKKRVCEMMEERVRLIEENEMLRAERPEKGAAT